MRPDSLLRLGPRVGSPTNNQRPGALTLCGESDRVCAAAGDVSAESYTSCDGAGLNWVATAGALPA
jgi:hypothetical protein